MANIVTVTGPVPADQLGRTLMHEHVICDFYRVTGQLNQLLNDEQLAIDELRPLRDAGGSSLVECTTIDMGRDISALRRISEASGVHIVASTGWYHQRYYPPQIDQHTTNDLAQHLINELTLGVADTGIRAGVIGEIGAHLDYLTAQEERVLRAAARAQRATGALLMTHASMYPVGRHQLAILREEGVDLRRVVIGHCDTYLDETYHHELLLTGATIAFDTIGRNHMNPDDRRARAILKLVDAGWTSQLVLSTDRCHRSDLVAFGGVGYAHLLGTFVAQLASLGVAESDLDLMVRANPCRLLIWDA